MLNENMLSLLEFYLSIGIVCCVLFLLLIIFLIFILVVKNASEEEHEKEKKKIIELEQEIKFLKSHFWNIGVNYGRKGNDVQ